MASSAVVARHVIIMCLPLQSHNAPLPLPPYMESSRATPTSALPFDTCYHLLQLYCYRDHSLEVTFAPSGSTPFQLDYRIRYT